eukprot:CAMPEP_0119104806 /NCGR_PEP_ID=MMETSP1180-20130426/2926_1 /TAXON_ID=3052 ORGANISM="Chlamydomonas cf sp, Strain CCMP681" /NCGR_SAMPLE_ID=MMETSP1180 /ASSEMBLY_ACC=CAM_ASM_000741 /LENGTH=502 /DNA_ID=CAMNT_0007089655 /DNA_START=10 /DNA_END=1518 /DNA_ORIENTATION=-
MAPAISDSKDEVLRWLGRYLVLPVPDGRYRAPIITLSQAESGSNLYSLLERLLRIEYLVGAEKFFKIVRLDQHLDTWRPRVHGTQLKALLNTRLPEHQEEYAAVEQAVSAVCFALRSDVTPEIFVIELRKFVAGVEVWWDGRNSRRPQGEVLLPSVGIKRPAPMQSGPSQSKHVQMQMQMPQSVQHLQPQSSTRRPHVQGGRAQDPYPPSSSPGIPPSGANMLRMPENGMGSRDSPDDMGYVPNGAGADLNAYLHSILPRNGQMMGGPSLMPLPGSNEPLSMVHLNVGGTQYTTTVATLLSVPGSRFWELLGATGGPGADPPVQTASGELFLDRNGQVFHYVLEYLRGMANGEPFSPLPSEATELTSLAREADYYGLPGLVGLIQNQSISPEPGTRSVYDSVYLETGFLSIEGASLKDMEHRKTVVMQQMNHVLHSKALDGFLVASCNCGVNHQHQDGGMLHNLYYHVLLRRSVPVLLGGSGQHGMPMGGPMQMPRRTAPGM